MRRWEDHEKRFVPGVLNIRRMLSVLIPIFNCEVGPFVDALHRQSTRCHVPFEILCYDDGSDERHKTANRHLLHKPFVRYVELPENIGRSRIRNKMAADASYENLLLVDCDSAVIDEHFIERWVAWLDRGTVVYGGRCYHRDPPHDTRLYLRWLYGVKRESQPAALRKAYKSLMTNNLLIPKKVWQKFPLDEGLVGYGHEDTLLGMQLKGGKIPIVHIENPLLHEGLEAHGIFLQKTREGVANLWRLKKTGIEMSDVKILHTYDRLVSSGLAIPARLILWLLGGVIIANLHSPKPRLFWFDLFKLRYLLAAASARR